MENLINDFNIQSNIIQQKLKASRSMPTEDLESIQADFDRADKSIGLINSEYSALSANLRSQFRGSIEEKKTKLIRLKKDFERELERRRLQEISRDSDLNEKNFKRKLLGTERLDEMNSRMGKVGDRMGEINRNFAVAANELNDQEKAMDRIIEKTNSTNEKLTVHQQILGVMQNRELWRKLKLILIVGVLIVGNIVVLVIKLRR